MEVKPGYKKTEIGVIPDDWEVKPLKQISPKQSVGLVINPSTYFEDDGTVPMLVGSNISENRIDWESARRISDPSNDLLSSSRLAANDLVTVRVGEPGTTAVVPPELDGCNCASMMIVRQHQTFDSYWLSYVMNSRIGLTQVKNVQYGTAQKQFNISDAINFIFPVPRISEQRVIAAALSDVDSLLAALDALIAKKRLIKQGAMQELLTEKKRLPGFSGEWEVKKLGEIGEIDSENLASKTDPDYSFKYISLEDVESGTLKGYTELTFRFAPSRARRKIRKNDILIATVRPNLQSHLLIRKDVSDMICSTGFSVLRCNPNLAISTYVYFHLFAHHVGQQIESLLTGSNYPAINSNDVRELLIPLPSLAEQTAIAEILSDMDAEIAALEARREKTRLLKQGMMQELLTGKTRLL
jgi:type I restriction enzyme S subunit